MGRPTSFRPDIEGLRALAVMAVIAHHATPDLLPGGYLGVDLFFVISGYVITGSLIGRSETSLPRAISAFYTRRIKRLFPALAVVVLVSAVALCMVDPSPGRQLLTGLFALIGMSNVYLWRSGSDYFSDGIETDPFVHTWSLGVEEQFYFVWPLLIWYVTSQSKHKSFVLVVLSAFSVSTLIAFVMLRDSHANATFYLMPFRFWQMAIGGLLLLWIAARGPVRMSWAAPVALVAMLALFGSKPSLTPWANVAAVCCAAVMLVAQNGPASWLLSRKPMLFVGRISYSAYLWHWPILTIAGLTVGVSSSTLPGLFVTIFVVASVSFFVVENPLRHSKWSWPWTAVAVAGVFGPVALLFGPLNGALYTGRVDLIAYGGESLTLDYVVPSTNYKWQPGNCVLTSNTEVGKPISSENCTLGPGLRERPRILVLGDSFSAAMVGVFDEIIAQGDASVTVASSWDASPVPSVPNSSRWDAANDYYWAVVAPRLIDELREGDRVVLVSDLADFSPSDSMSSEDVRAADERRRLLRMGISQMSQSLRSKGVGLAIIYGTGFVRDAHCTPALAIPQWYHFGSNRCRVFTRGETLARRSALQNDLMDAAIKNEAVVIDLIDVFCGPQVCGYQSPKGTVLYRDEWSHPSIEASRASAAFVQRSLFKQ